jgi:hypothetical protein
MALVSSLCAGDVDHLGLEAPLARAIHILVMADHLDLEVKEAGFLGAAI